MRSEVKTVTAYLKEVPEERKKILNKLREYCLKILNDYEESMEYGMPCYKKPGGEIEVAFASQKNYISLYILKTNIVKNNMSLLQGAKVGKSCIKFTKPEHMDFSVIEILLRDTVNLQELPCE
jgi:uncharacterized protein YdhG (YjbR/CyaY superfamily)